MFDIDKVDTVYIACGTTDLRKSIDHKNSEIKSKNKEEDIKNIHFKKVIYCTYKLYYGRKY